REEERGEGVRGEVEPEPYAGEQARADDELADHAAAIGERAHEGGHGEARPRPDAEEDADLGPAQPLGVEVDREEGQHDAGPAEVADEVEGEAQGSGHGAPQASTSEARARAPSARVVVRAGGRYSSVCRSLL